MKLCSTSWTIREMQIKQTLTYHYILIRMVKIKNSDNTKWWEFRETKLFIPYFSFIVLFHHGFHFHFPNGAWYWTSFHMLICKTSFLKCMFKSFVHFKIGLFIYFFWVFRFLYILGMIAFCLLYDLQYFLPVYSFLFNSLNSASHSSKNFSFMNPINHFFILWNVLRHVSKNFFLH